MVAIVVGIVIGIALGYGFRGLINRKGKAVEARLAEVVKQEISK